MLIPIKCYYSRIYKVFLKNTAKFICLSEFCTNMKFNKLIPELSVSDFTRSLKFYTDIGFKVEYTRENFAFLSLQGSQIMIEKANDKWRTGDLEKPFGRGINFQIEIDDIKLVLKLLKKNNYPIFAEPEDNWYKVKDKLIGSREFLVQDPDGYLLRFSKNLGFKESQ